MSPGMILLALTLGLDVFAGGLALGVMGLERPRWPKVTLLFGLLTLILLLAGVLIGRLLDDSLGNVAAYIAGAALLVFGIRAVAEAFQKGHEHPDVVPSLDLRAIFSTGLMVNLDKLAVGVSLAILESTPFSLIAYVSVQSVAATWLGLLLGKRLGARAGEAAAVLAGMVFVLLGGFIIWDAATGGGNLS